MLPARPKRQWAGLDLDRPRIMGVLNVTPDSFSDGGLRTDPRTAVAAGLAMVADGADIIDIGGESTRPGALPTSPGVEQGRVIPVIRALASEGITVSIDTRHAGTMQAALAAGARIVNDVSGLAYDPCSAGVIAESGCSVVVMHMRGTPTDMMKHAVYHDVVAEVRSELSTRVEAALAGGVQPEQIAIDPGIGFAKHAAESQAILRGLPTLAGLGYPLLVGVSRKSFIGTLSVEHQADHRLGGSLAAGLFAVLKGASILRVHDVRHTVQAIRVWHTLFE